MTMFKNSTVIVLSWFLLFTFSVFGVEVEDQVVGERPIEMIWANRTTDTRPPLIDFEDLTGWTVEARNAEARLIQSREQQIWGKYTGKLVYRRTSETPSVILRPPRPVRITAPFDCVNFWTYGNSIWVPDSSDPGRVNLLIESESGVEDVLEIGRLSWPRWSLHHRKLELREPALLTGIEVVDFSNEGDRSVFFDNLSIYKEELEPLEFKASPRRGVDPFPGQTPGLNTGTGRLPFPTRPETILPTNATGDFVTSLDQDGNAFVFRYRGSDGELTYVYEPQTGTLSDLRASWQGRGKVFQPIVDGGVYGTDGNRGDFEIISCERQDDSVLSTWKWTCDGVSSEVTYTFRLWQKSLVVDVKCLGGQVDLFRTGKAVGLENPRLITIPFLIFNARDGTRPGVLIAGSSDKPLFVSAWFDWYRSNASRFGFDFRIADDGAYCLTSADYLPRSDGRRNDCFERLFLTVSPDFQETLPTVANPKSPWMDVMGTRLFRNSGFCSNRESNKVYLDRWKDVARYGINQIILTNHESGWSDYWDESSSTFRRRTARLKGGDAHQARLTRQLKALGFRYGPYNNYCAYLPVNEYWDEDFTIRTPSGQWLQQYPHPSMHYAVKPSRAVQLEEEIAPILKDTFDFDCAYLDVHTAWGTFSYVDYDARVPGAGTFAATYYAYGELMLNQQNVWQGPVFGEGGVHWIYAGLIGGTYASEYNHSSLWRGPWLVDFELLKVHPLSCNAGMGNLAMFYSMEGLAKTPKEREPKLDRFLAATIAFGHIGWLDQNEGIRGMVRSYFLLQQLQSRYTRADAVEIRYADASGALLDTSSAIATGAHERCQIFVRYSNGLSVWVNGHPTETWEVPAGTLPPNGWHTQGKDGSFIEYSAMKDGRRVDYVESPEYDYADGRGTFTHFDRLSADGALIAHRNEDGTVELIPVECKQWCGVSMDGRDGTATALDQQGDNMGICEVRSARGLVYVLPKPDAFSYLLRPAGLLKSPLTCDVRQVTPGQSVIVRGAEEHTFRVSVEAKAGDRIWKQLEGEWIDFTVVPIAQISPAVTPDHALELTITSGLASEAEFVAEVEGTSRRATIGPGVSRKLQFVLPAPEREELKPLNVTLRAAETQQEHKWWLHARRVGSSKGRLEYAIYDSQDDVTFQPATYSSRGLSAADLKSARAAWLRMDVLGGIVRNAVNAEINGVRIGELPATPSYFSDIRNDKWSPIYLQFPSDVIAALQAENSIVLNNPGECVFKARRFWVELETADGRRVSSRITSRVETQPPGYFFDANMHYPTNPYFYRPTRTDVVFALED